MLNTTLTDTFFHAQIDPATTSHSLNMNIDNTQSAAQNNHTNYHLTFVQLNCHVSKEITLTVLHHLSSTSILLLQKVWLNPFTLLPLTHKDWNLLTGYKHTPQDWQDPHKACIYVQKTIPSQHLTQLPNNSEHFLAVQIQDTNGNHLTLVNVYNPPGSNLGLKDLGSWMETHHNQQRPTCIFMDANLHH